MSLIQTATKRTPVPSITRDVAELGDTRLPKTGSAREATAQVLLQRPSRRERRRAARYACQMETACVVISLVEPVLLAVKVRDISQTGIGLVLSSRLHPGAFVAVKLQGPRHPAPRILRAQVMHATAQKDRRSWLAGCSFIGELGKEELALLV